MQKYEIDHLQRLRNNLAECMVFLKKNGAFPLDAACRIAAYGNGVRNTVKGGTGSGEVNSRYFVTVEEGLKQAGFDLISGDWLDAYEKLKPELKKQYIRRKKAESKAKGEKANIMGIPVPEQNYELPLRFDADAAIYVVSRNAGEQQDRAPVEGDIMLSQTEVRDILLLNQHYARFMLVLNTGGPVDLSPVLEVGNILVLSQLGVETGCALADVLLGKTNPSGKLTATWAVWKDYCPDIEFGREDYVRYFEGIYVGYRYFDTVGKKALFPFGYGCSYTEFSVSNSVVSVVNGEIRVDADVRNVGKKAGKEVVQVYVTAPEEKLRKPWQELVGFAKTRELQPGETQTVRVQFSMEDITSFDERRDAYILESGEYIVRVGNSSVDTQIAAVMELPEEVIVKKVRSLTEKPDFEEKYYPRHMDAVVPSDIPHITVDPKIIQTAETVYDTEAPVEKLIAELSDEELCYLQVGNLSGGGFAASLIGCQSQLVAGGAGDTTRRLVDKGIPAISMADGPAGLRLARQSFEKNGCMKPIVRSVLPDAMLDDMPPLGAWVCTTFFGGAKPPKNAEIREQYCTALPIGTAVAQTWNMDFAKMCGDIVGEEMERFGVNLWLAPGMNIHRSPLCGRNFEYYSEDPLLTGKIAAAITLGVQAHPGCGTTLKHYAVNNQEFCRTDNDSRIHERTLREIYLRAFAICVKEARPYAIMSSYNLLNGTHTSEHRPLTEDFLRAENGFTGIVMTDWVLPLVALGAKHHKAASADCVAAAGGDIYMPGVKADYKRLLKAMKEGRLSRHQLEQNASRIYRICRKLSEESSCHKSR